MTRSLLLLLCISLAGCSALINPDSDQLGGDVDAGPVVTFDASRPDAGGPPPSSDAGATDAGPPASCEPFEPYCSGDSVIACADGVETSRDCQLEGSYCAEGGCRPWNCMPGSRACNPGLESVLACDARGIEEQEIDCEEGACDPATGACTDVPPGACDELESIGVGDDRRVDLCERPNDHTFRAGGDCDPRFDADAGDQIFALRIERAGNYRIELEDEAILRDIDTVLYIRRQCDEPRSQSSCSDDTRCEPTPGPFPGGDCRDGIDLGLSRLEGFLDVGTYYLVVDAFLYEREGFTAECGTVELRVREAG